MKLNHPPLETCKEWLPKPKKKYKSVIVQCEWCKKLYVGSWNYGYVWESLKVLKGEK